jgi:hypothetical protein
MFTALIGFLLLMAILWVSVIVLRTSLYLLDMVLPQRFQDLFSTQIAILQDLILLSKPLHRLSTRGRQVAFFPGLAMVSPKYVKVVATARLLQGYIEGPQEDLLPWNVELSLVPEKDRTGSFIFLYKHVI